MKKFIAIISVFFASAFNVSAADNDQEFGEKVKAYLMENPQVIQQALEMGKRKAQQEEMRRLMEKTSEYVPSMNKKGGIPEMGKDNASVIVYEFMDYNCGWCKRTNDSVKRLKSENDVKVRYMMFPVLSNRTNGGSMRKAKFAIAAMKMGKFAEVHDKLYDAPVEFQAEDMKKLSFEAGIDYMELIKVLEDESNFTHMDMVMGYANKINITGTPFFIVGKTPFPGGVPYEALKGSYDTIMSMKN